MWKFYVRHGMIVHKNHEIISCKQHKWFQKHISINTQKRNEAKNDFEKYFYKLLNNAFYEKTMKNVQIRLRLEIIKKDKYKKIVEQQSKMTFSGIHKSYEYCDGYSFKQNEIKMDKPIYLGLAVLELNKLQMHGTFYDKLQPYFGQEKSQLHYKDTDAFLLRMNTKDIFEDSKNLEDLFDFSNLDKNHEVFSKKKQKSNWKT